MSSPLVTIDVVIVNWNAGPLLGPCVRAVLTADQTTVALRRVTIVDNASTDGSLAAGDLTDERVSILRNATNRGFAAACNQGAAGSTADLLLFLNPDTRVAKDALAVPAAFLMDERHQDVAICGVRMTDDTGATLASSRRFPTLRGIAGEVTRLSRILPALWPPLLLPPSLAVAQEVDQVIGAFLLIRRRVFEELGGFDERFFVYYEDVDLSKRARDRGWRSMYLTGTSAFHHGGFSSGQAPASRLFYSLRSRTLYARKHWATIDRVGLQVLTFAIELPLRLLSAAARLSVREAAGTIAAYARLCAWWLTRRTSGFSRMG